MSVNPKSITLRHATPDDQPFLLSVYAATRGDLNLANLDDIQRQALIEMQFTARQQQYKLAYPQASCSVILEDTTAIGSMTVNRGEHDIVLVDIALLPEHRNRGVGAGLVKTLQQEAAIAGKRVCLHVLVTSPAVRFYERLGFSNAGDGGAYLSMDWHSQSQARNEFVRESQLSFADGISEQRR